jgi:hypothetical protein
MANPTPPGPRRDCACKNVTHRHGTDRAYRADNCRCAACKAAHSAAAVRIYRAQGYGTWDNGRTDAAPVREHLTMLLEQGLTMYAIATATDVSHTAITAILHGRTDRPGKPYKTTTTDLAERILAFNPAPSNLRDTAIVPAVGGHRRLHALAALGWPQTALAARLNLTPTAYSALLRRTHITAARAKTIHALYNELWNTPPIPGKDATATAITRARARARRESWAPPMAWDDDTIDNPTASPDTTSPRRAPGRPRTIEALAEDVEFMYAAGASVSEIEQRTAHSWADIRSMLRRAGQARVLNRIDRSTLPRTA